METRRMDKILNRVVDAVRSTGNENVERKSAKHDLVKHVYDGRHGLSVARVMSVGSDQQVVHLWDSDIDTPIFLSAMTQVEFFERYEANLKRVEECLAEFAGEGMSRRFGGNSLTVMHAGFEFDVLLAFDTGQEEAERLKTLYRIAKYALTDPSAEERAKKLYRLGPSFGQERAKFVRALPEVVHRAIVLAKFWKSDVKSRSKIPGDKNFFYSLKSYGVGLIVIYLYKQYIHADVKLSTAKLFQGFLEFMVKPHHIYFTDFYNRADWPDVEPLKNSFIISDFVHPQANLAEQLTSGRLKCWESMAQDTLGRMSRINSSTEPSDIFPSITTDKDVKYRFRIPEIRWWCYKVRYGWHPFVEELNKDFRACQADGKRVVYFDRRDQSYSVDLHNKVQKNLNSGRLREINIIQSPDEWTFSGNGRWLWEDTELKTEGYYEPSVSKKLEEAYLEGKSQILLSVDGRSNSFNFCCQTEMDTERRYIAHLGCATKYVRQIRREKSD